jgi:DNA-binding NarL/FixJ family response regulator
MGGASFWTLRIQKLLSQRPFDIAVVIATDMQDVLSQVGKYERGVEHLVVLYIRGHQASELDLMGELLSQRGVSSVLVGTDSRPVAQHALRSGVKVLVALPASDEALVLGLEHLVRGDIYVPARFALPWSEEESLGDPGPLRWPSTVPHEHVGLVAAQQFPCTLTVREQQIAQLLKDRLASKEIATLLGISPWTVFTHVKNLYRKLGVTSRSDLRRLF